MPHQTIFPYLKTRSFILKHDAPMKNTRFNVSQNHRIIGAGRELCGLSSPTPLPRSPRAGCTGPCPGGF